MSGTGTLWLATRSAFQDDWFERLGAAYAELGVHDAGLTGSAREADHEEELLALLQACSEGAGDVGKLLHLSELQLGRRFAAASLAAASTHIADAPRFFVVLNPNRFSSRLADCYARHASTRRGTLALTDLCVSRGAGLLWNESPEGELVVHDWCRWRFGLCGFGWLGSWDYEEELLSYPPVVEWRLAFERHFGPMQAALCWSC